MKNKIIITICALIFSISTLAGFSLAMAQNATTAAIPTPAAVSTATTVPPAPTSAREGFSLSPANGQASMRNFLFTLKAGETQNAKATIKNFSSETVHFYLYGADPTLSNTGSLAYETRDQSGDGPGSWVKFATPGLDLGPDEEKTVELTITVPAETKPGEYRAGVTMEKNKPAANNPGITIATRVVNHAKIMVTSPDGLTPTPTVTPATTPAPAPTGWQKYYFWISFGLFLASLALLIWTIFYGKKHKARNEQPHTHDHKAHNHNAHAKGKHERK